LISAINQDPQVAIKDRLLREDLYYRLNTVELPLPPLRERKEDIPMLFSLFLQRAAEIYDREPEMPGPAGYSALMGYRWPGNVRELKSVAERYVLSNLAKEERLSNLLARYQGSQPVTGASLSDHVRFFERQLIKDALKRHNGNIQQVMAELGVPRRTLNEKMAKYGLTRP
jgi:two-component system C4-dicarboxylate transport response regulator DctD